MSGIKLAMINRAGVAALPLVVAKLLPGGKIFGRDYIARERRRTDRRPGSLKVKLFGAHAGTWADFATGDRGGDPVSLVAYLERMSEADAARHLASMLGIVP
jgi:hypothetical protein